jgi:hypothetical protein
MNNFVFPYNDYMKKILYIVLFFPLYAFAQYGNNIFVSGSGWLQVALIDKGTKQIEWWYDLNATDDCETVTLTTEGYVLISYKTGAKLIDYDKNIIWDYPLESRGELFSAIQLSDGGYLLAHSGNPAKLIELDGNGKIRKTIEFDTEVENLHGQMRQVIKTKQETYLLPIMSRGEVVELDGEGKEILRFNVEGNPFSLLELRNGNLLVSCGDAHCAIEVERHSGKFVRKIDRTDVEGVSLNFVAQIMELNNGNLLICNWNGHVRGDEAKQPALIEIDRQNNLIWQLEEGNGIGKISCIYTIEEPERWSKFFNKNSK